MMKTLSFLLALFYFDVNPFLHYENRQIGQSSSSGTLSSWL